MNRQLILASGSSIRADLLRKAGLEIKVIPARVDEDSIKAAVISEGAGPRDIADTLAEAKARRIAQKHPEALVLGCDQIAEIDAEILSKPQSEDEAAAQIRRLSGREHKLLSAAVLYDHNRPVWRHVGQVRLQMRDVSEHYVNDYVARNWHSIRHSVGAYKLEEEGVRLFTQIDGDYFTVLGLPLIELLSFLTGRGELEI